MTVAEVAKALSSIPEQDQPVEFHTCGAENGQYKSFAWARQLRIEPCVSTAGEKWMVVHVIPEAKCVLV